jgi:hypothetical protein
MESDTQKQSLKRYNPDTWESDSGLSGGVCMEESSKGAYVLFEDTKSYLPPETILQHYTLKYCESECFSWINGYKMENSSEGLYVLYEDVEPYLDLLDFKD